MREKKLHQLIIEECIKPENHDAAFERAMEVIRNMPPPKKKKATPFYLRRVVVSTVAILLVFSVALLSILLPQTSGGGDPIGTTEPSYPTASPGPIHYAADDAERMEGVTQLADLENIYDGNLTLMGYGELVACYQSKTEPHVPVYFDVKYNNPDTMVTINVVVFLVESFDYSAESEFKLDQTMSIGDKIYDYRMLDPKPFDEIPGFYTYTVKTKFTHNNYTFYITADYVDIETGGGTPNIFNEIIPHLL